MSETLGNALVLLRKRAATAFHRVTLFHRNSMRVIVVGVAVVLGSAALGVGACDEQESITSAVVCIRIQTSTIDGGGVVECELTRFARPPRAGSVIPLAGDESEADLAVIASGELGIQPWEQISVQVGKDFVREMAPGLWYVRPRVEGMVADGEWIPVGPAVGRHLGVLRIRPASKREVTVVDVNGSPAPLAHVRCCWAEPDGAAALVRDEPLGWEDATADEHGRAVFHRTPAGAIKIIVGRCEAFSSVVSSTESSIVVKTAYANEDTQTYAGATLPKSAHRRFSARQVVEGRLRWFLRDGPMGEEDGDHGTSPVAADIELKVVSGRVEFGRRWTRSDLQREAGWSPWDTARVQVRVKLVGDPRGPRERVLILGYTGDSPVRTSGLVDERGIGIATWLRGATPDYIELWEGSSISHATMGKTEGADQDRTVELVVGTIRSGTVLNHDRSPAVHAKVLLRSGQAFTDRAGRFSARVASLDEIAHARVVTRDGSTRSAAAFEADSSTVVLDRGK